MEGPSPFGKREKTHLSPENSEEPYFRLPTGGRALELPMLGAEAEETVEILVLRVCSLELRGLNKR